MALLSFLDREKSIAQPGFNRWLVPPAALAIHLSIGQAYAFSVFKIPLTQLLGVSKSLPDDWRQPQIAWIFSLAIVILGLSAATFGKWLEGAGPRKAMFASAVCFGMGFFISYLGVVGHQLWLLYLGYGVVGGTGLGLGYISPVSTLIKWFPDRPGLATGMAIMGFGGGAMIGSPLAIKLMAHFRNPTDVGVGKTFLVMGSIYFIFMMFGVFTIRVPREGWKPEGWVPSAKPNEMITSHNVEVNTAFRTPQFWLLWIVLCTNVTAGIGIIEQASPMIQDLFKGAIGPVAAGGFVGLLSLFNMGGRFFWSSLSDDIGRKTTYFIFFALGAVLYFLLPETGANHWNNIKLFVVIACVLLSMYGGGFATIPAYLRDMFGTYNVSAIHGRLLTAWSTAGVLGPLLVNHMREYELQHGADKASAYQSVLHVMAALLVVGLIANLLVRPVAEKYWLSEQKAAK
ncbi:MAG TPA: OFA family MFS transporter [Candidatus Sulfotelmatobacter sp.]|jgi:MFS family permease|nr:OFA family MFS transporter [Candidatus Sulfotelmatobacter sp.]